MLDKLIHRWVTRTRAANKVATIAVQAMKFAKELIEKAADKDAPEIKALKDFKSSNHWVEQFMKRHNLHNATLSGEANSVSAADAAAGRR